MESQGYIKIFSGNFIMAQRISVALEEQGISPITKDETESGRLAGFGPSISGFQELFIHEDELEKAQQIVDAIQNEMQA